MDLNPYVIQESTVFDAGKRAMRQAQRATPCIETDHEWTVFQESILYYDRKVVTEVCLWCDQVQAFIQRINHG